MGPFDSGLLVLRVWQRAAVVRIVRMARGGRSGGRSLRWDGLRSRRLAAAGFPGVLFAFGAAGQAAMGGASPVSQKHSILRVLSPILASINVSRLTYPG